MNNTIHNRIDTVFVHVTDLERSVKWYCDIMGMKHPHGPFDGPIFTLHMGDGRPGLTFDNHCWDNHYELIPSNQPLFNLSTTDIHAAYEHVKLCGAEIVSEIEVFPDLSSFNFKDPDGNIIMACTCFS